MKIVVVGCGKIGTAIIANLVKEGHDITAVDTSDTVISNLTNNFDIMTVNGNGVDSDVLEEAGTKKADLFVAVTSQDEQNMLMCFIAKKLGAKHTIARIRNPEYNDRNLSFVQKQLELSRTMNPELLAAQQIFNIIKFPSAIKIEMFSTRRFEMVELRLKSESVLDGMTLRELRNNYKAKVLVCAVQRDNVTVIPDGNFALKSGDLIELAASPVEIQKFLKELGAFQKQARSIMIVGGSRIAHYLADMLTGLENEVKIVELDKKTCEDLSSALPNATIIEGNGMNHEVLSEEGIDTADAFVALTGMDEENILVSIYAQQKKIPTVITKVNSEELSHIAENLGLDCIITPAHIVSNEVIRYARALQNSVGSKMKTLYMLMDGQAEAVEFSVKLESKCIDIPLKHLPIQDNILIVGIIRDKKTIVPSGDDTIMPDDSVIVVSTGHHLTTLDDILVW
ncbi:MAG: Trk system potassium transporter TrkA [Clostridia bacterium]|nr:Trk system potassium transporter TrkA [Clostridia bacterium]